MVNPADIGLKTRKCIFSPVSAIFETLLSSRDSYRLVTSVLAVADIFSVFTAKNIQRMSKKVYRMRPKTSSNYDILKQEGQEALNRSPEYTGQKSNI